MCGMYVRVHYLYPDVTCHDFQVYITNDPNDFSRAISVSHHGNFDGLIYALIMPLYYNFETANMWTILGCFCCLVS